MGLCWNRNWPVFPLVLMKSVQLQENPANCEASLPFDIGASAACFSGGGLGVPRVSATLLKTGS